MSQETILTKGFFLFVSRRLWSTLNCVVAVCKACCWRHVLCCENVTTWLLLLLHHGSILLPILWLSVLFFPEVWGSPFAWKWLNCYAAQLKNESLWIFAFFNQLLVWDVNCTALFSSDAFVFIVLLNIKCTKKLVFSFYCDFHSYFDTIYSLYIFF